MPGLKAITTCVGSIQGEAPIFPYNLNAEPNNRKNRRFFDHRALNPYKWYWRVDPDVEFTCAIT